MGFIVLNQTNILLTIKLKLEVTYQSLIIANGPSTIEVSSGIQIEVGNCNKMRLRLIKLRLQILKVKLLNTKFMIFY